MSDRTELRRLVDYFNDEDDTEGQAGDLNNDSTVTTAIRVLRERKAEVKRLREALEEIVTYNDRETHGTTAYGFLLGKIQEIAKQALGQRTAEGTADTTRKGGER